MTILTDYETRSSRKRSAVVWTGLIIIGCWWVFSAHDPRPVEAAPPAPKVKPLSQRMGCPEWRPGLTRSFVIFALEDEHGQLRQIQCERYKERRKTRPTAL